MICSGNNQLFLSKENTNQPCKVQDHGTQDAHGKGGHPRPMVPKLSPGGPLCMLILVPTTIAIPEL